MSQNILITGASGYLGGTLMNRLNQTTLSPYGKLYALVRTKEQAEAVKKYGAEPLTFDTYDEKAVQENVSRYQINVVFFLLDAFASTSQEYFIKALGNLKESTGQDVHFLHTSGAKMLSSHCGAPADRTHSDIDKDLYDTQKKQKARVAMMQKPIETNNTVIELSESLRVRSYIFFPCIVYGKGEGFGNPISIQTKAIVMAAKGAKQVYKVDKERTIWPVSHVVDTATLYIQLLKRILAGENPGYGKNGYYLASSGSVAWEDIYSAIAEALYKRGTITSEDITLADESALNEMADALGCDKEMVAPQIGGNCLFDARHGEEIGWKSKYAAEHILEAMDAEVELILDNIKD